MANWNKRFIDLSHFVSEWSKDSNKKVGAVIVDDSKRIISTGCNGFPSGINDDVEERHKKPLKFFYFIHAEANAIYNAAKNGVKLEGSTMYVTFHPCAICAQAIRQVGIKKVVCYEPDLNSSWVETCTIAKTIFDESGVEVEYYKEQ